MAEYIEKQAAIEAICFLCAEVNICGNSCDTTDRIRKIPPADVRPVVRGEWIADGISGILKCTRCDNDAPLCTTGGGQYESYFCPSCGADMRGDAE